MGEGRGAFCSLAPGELAARIDHAVLKPWSGRSELERAVDELEELGLRCLILSPTLLREARGITSRCLGAVVGFPFGYHTIEAKIKEIEDAIAMGADEIDYVVNTQLYLIGRREEYLNEVKAAIEICRNAKVKCKVIIEAPALTPSQVEEVVRLVASLSPSFIKTSTGYGPRPTLPEDVALIDRVLRNMGKRSSVGIKAAGGIRSGLQAAAMITAGADIIGTSTPRQVLETYRAACTTS